MYNIRVETTFSALHRVHLPDGSLEPIHGHDWVVRAIFGADQLDRHGMVVDFLEARSALEAAVAPLHHGDLNDYPAFAEKSPTAENVARTVFDHIYGQGFSRLLLRVEVIEAPGCLATYEPSP